MNCHRSYFNTITVLTLLGLTFLLGIPHPSEANDAPQIEYVADRTISAIETLYVPVRVFDDNPEIPWLWAESLPDGASFNDAGDGTRFLLWSPGADQVGTYTVRFVAADALDQSLRSIREIRIEVTSAGFISPAFDIIAPLEVLAMPGEPLSVRVRTVDSDGSVPGLMAEQLPDGATFDDNGDGSRSLNWIPQVADQGVHLVRFFAEPVNFINWSTQHDLTIIVAADSGMDSSKPIAPHLSFPVAPTAVAGELVSFRIGTTVPGTAVPSLIGMDLPPGARFDDNGDGSRQFIWQTSTGDTGRYELRFRATDPDSLASSEITVYLVVKPDPGLAEASQRILVDQPVKDVSLEGGLLDEPFAEGTTALQASTGFLQHTLQVIVNDTSRHAVRLLPGENRIAIEHAESGQRVLLQVSRLFQPETPLSLGRHYAGTVSASDDYLAVGEGSKFLVWPTHVDRMPISVNNPPIVQSVDFDWTMPNNHSASVDSVSVDGDWLAAATLLETTQPPGVSLYKRVEGHWTLEPQIPSVEHLDHGFGGPVSIDGDTLAISAMHDYGTGDGLEPIANAGAVKMFQFDGQNWIPETILRPENRTVDANFGSDVDLHGDRVVVAAFGLSIYGQNSHVGRKVYIFEREQNHWKQTAVFSGGESFGHAVSIWNDVVVIGEPGYSVEGRARGAAHIYRKNDAGWKLEQTLTTNRIHAASFGHELALVDEQLLLASGQRVYLYELHDSLWQSVWSMEYGATGVALRDGLMAVTGYDGPTLVFIDD